MSSDSKKAPGDTQTSHDSSVETSHGISATTRTSVSINISIDSMCYCGISNFNNRTGVAHLSHTKL